MRTFGRRLPGTVGLPPVSGAVPEPAGVSERQAVRPAGSSGPASATQGRVMVPTVDAAFRPLSGNAFAVLGLPLDANQDRITQRVDDLAFEEGQDEAALQAARASLFSARDRLGQEIGWLPECTANQQQAAIAALGRGDAAALLHVAGRTTGLAAINLFEAGADLRSIDVQPAFDLIETIARWEPETTLNVLDEARGRGGYRPIDLDQWERAVTARLGDAAARLGPLIAASPEGRARLTGTVHRSAQPGSTLASFLEALQSAYAAAIQEPLGRLEMRIQTSVALIDADPANAMQINSLIAALNQWSAYRRPIQVMEAARALDDGESARIFDSLLGLTIKIANTHDQQAVALRLAEALLDAFAHLPQQRKRLEQQMPVLLGNVAVQRLTELGERIARQRSRFVAQVKSGRMGPKAKGLAAELVECFDATLEAAEGKRVAPFQLARAIIIATYNATRDRQCATILFRWLLDQDPPETVRDLLKQDLNRLTAGVTGWAVGIASIVLLLMRCSEHRNVPLRTVPAAPTSSGAAFGGAATGAASTGGAPSGGSAREQASDASGSAAEAQANARAEELARVREQIRQSNAEAERVRAANDAARAKGMRREWEEPRPRPTWSRGYGYGDGGYGPPNGATSTTSTISTSSTAQGGKP
ncbi:hypothetical protein WBP06_26165 [Novosphingobium sp. BL-8H]|uniref:hypothetical protein n=1 Tax=Novosphingobium sp. BL-8H TaxID=3127640 RepID=UPI00375725FE